MIHVQIAAFITLVIGGVVIHLGAKPESGLLPYIGAFLWMVATAMLSMIREDKLKSEIYEIKSKLASKNKIS